MTVQAIRSTRSAWPSRSLGRRAADHARQGQDADWFASPFILTLAIIAAIGFVAFLIWELTDEHPIVDLSVFRQPDFQRLAAAMAFTFGAFFATVVLTPLWLQTNMGYTATWAR